MPIRKEPITKGFSLKEEEYKGHVRTPTLDYKAILEEFTNGASNSVRIESKTNPSSIYIGLLDVLRPRDRNNKRPKENLAEYKSIAVHLVHENKKPKCVFLVKN